MKLPVRLVRKEARIFAHLSMEPSIDVSRAFTSPGGRIATRSGWLLLIPLRLKGKTS